MAQLVEFPFRDGGSVLVEITEQARPTTRGLGGASVIERAQQTFEDAIAQVRPAIDSVVNQLRSLTDAPDEVHVEFGLDLHLSAGVVISAASTTANFKVALKWRRTSG